MNRKQEPMEKTHPITIKHHPPLLTQTNLLQLLRLASPSLPIGAYSYSQGLETAVASGWVDDESTTLDWIEGLLNHSLKYLDIPVFKQLYHSWKENRMEDIHYWSQVFLANRDAFEFQEEDRQLGKALARLLTDLGLQDAKSFLKEPDVCFLTMYSLAAVRWNISMSDAAIGLCWIWSENQVLAAVKLVPLGQTSGQKIVSELIRKIPETVNQGLTLQVDDIGYTAPAQGIAGALHETQYTRLFRS